MSGCHTVTHQHRVGMSLSPINIVSGCHTVTHQHRVGMSHCHPPASCRDITLSPQYPPAPCSMSHSTHPHRVRCHTVPTRIVSGCRRSADVSAARSRRRTWSRVAMVTRRTSCRQRPVRYRCCRWGPLPAAGWTPAALRPYCCWTLPQRRHAVGTQAPKGYSE